MYLQIVCQTRLAGDQRARRDSRHDSDAEDDDDVKKVCRPHLSHLPHLDLSPYWIKFLFSIYSQRCSHLWLLPPKNVRAEILFKIRPWTREESRGTAFVLGNVCKAFLSFISLFFHCKFSWINLQIIFSYSETGACLAYWWEHCRSLNRSLLCPQIG